MMFIVTVALLVARDKRLGKISMSGKCLTAI